MTDLLEAFGIRHLLLQLRTRLVCLLLPSSRLIGVVVCCADRPCGGTNIMRYDLWDTGESAQVPGAGLLW